MIRKKESGKSAKDAIIPYWAIHLSKNLNTQKWFPTNRVQEVVGLKYIISLGKQLNACINATK